MKTDYRVARDFWRNGNLVRAGELIALTARQAKYISHVLETPAAEAEVEAVVEDEAEKPAEAAVEADPAPVTDAEPEEAPKPARKARKAHGDGH